MKWPHPGGLAFVGGGAGVLFLVAAKLNIAKEWLQGLSLVLNLCGACCCSAAGPHCGGCGRRSRS